MQIKHKKKISFHLINLLFNNRTVNVSLFSFLSGKYFQLNKTTMINHWEEKYIN